jgi:hypothetical protein
VSFAVITLCVAYQKLFIIIIIIIIIIIDFVIGDSVRKLLDTSSCVYMCVCVCLFVCLFVCLCLLSLQHLQTDVRLPETLCKV